MIDTSQIGKPGSHEEKLLREIDRRVRFLRKRLEGMVVVSRPPDDRSRIFFGAWVRVEPAKRTQ